MNVHVRYTQAGRMMAIATKLGEDALLLEHLSIDEAINGLFTIEAQVKSQRDDLRAGDLIGSNVDFSLKLKDDGTRWWNGFVTDLHQGSLTSRGTRSYALTLRPKLWTLSQKSDCRIFRNTTVAQIIETLLSEHGITDFELRITQKLTPQDYSVQWNETDLAYMLRRMQQMGLFYWFEHKQGKHTMIVADHQSGYRNSSAPEVRYTEGSPAQDYINQWRLSYAYTPGRRAGADWNFLAMAAPRGEQTNFNLVPGSPSSELYEYPGRFDDSWSAEAAMKYRIQATETGFETVEAASTVRTLGPGQRFTPQDVAKPGDVFAQQVVTANRHEAQDRTYETNGGVPSYANTFTVTPATTPTTPHRTIPQPRIVGSQIALIAGPQGEEIFCDQWGRVKVWFPWDRRAVKDGSDTCWIRVGQPWAGGTWGHQVIPRVGMECLISYQEGDPDRPFVTALVPDPTNPTPYPLPDNKTRMTFRSNSYKSTGFNEMTFEDATGAENMFFHAQKDHTTKIENNQTLSVGANQASVVGQNQSMTVGQNMTFEAGKSINFTIGGTGAGAAPLMAPVAGLASVTATMLGESLGLASQSGGTSPPPATGGQAVNPPDVIGAVEKVLSGSVDTMVAPLVGSLIGILNQIGDQAQQQVWNGPSPRPDAGTALAAAGAELSEAVAALFSLPGMHNHITGTMKTEHVGCARVEQVGSSKVTHVGGNHSTRCEKDHGISAGRNVKVGAGGDWTVVSGDTATIGAVKNIALHAGRGVGIVSDNEMYLAAKEDIALTARSVAISATHAISLNVGEGNGITIKEDGTLWINAAKMVIVQAGQKISLQTPGASLNVTGGQVLAKPPIDPGGGGEGDAASVVQKVTEQTISKATDWKKWVAWLAGLGAKKSEEQLHLFTKGKDIVNDINSPDNYAHKSDAPNVTGPDDQLPPGTPVRDEKGNITYTK